jgi:hypothetical protein
VSYSDISSDRIGLSPQDTPTPSVSPNDVVIKPLYRARLAPISQRRDCCLLQFTWAMRRDCMVSYFHFAVFSRLLTVMMITKANVKWGPHRTYWTSSLAPQAWPSLVMLLPPRDGRAYVLPYSPWYQRSCFRPLWPISVPLRLSV